MLNPIKTQLSIKVFPENIALLERYYLMCQTMRMVQMRKGPNEKSCVERPIQHDYHGDMF